MIKSQQFALRVGLIKAGPAAKHQRMTSETTVKSQHDVSKTGTVAKAPKGDIPAKSKQYEMVCLVSKLAL